jgi:hypothetical protein
MQRAMLEHANEVDVLVLGALKRFIVALDCKAGATTHSIQCGQPSIRPF